MSWWTSPRNENSGEVYLDTRTRSSVSVTRSSRSLGRSELPGGSRSPLLIREGPIAGAYASWMAWLPLLRVVNPASAYVQRSLRALQGPLPPEQDADAQAGARGRTERFASVAKAPSSAFEIHARELLKAGTTEIPTARGAIDVRLVRFWNGAAILDCRLARTAGPTGLTFSLVDRRELRGDPVSVLARRLQTSILNLGADGETQ